MTLAAGICAALAACTPVEIRLPPPPADVAAAARVQNRTAVAAFDRVCLRNWRNIGRSRSAARGDGFRDFRTNRTAVAAEKPIAPVAGMSRPLDARLLYAMVGRDQCSIAFEGMRAVTPEAELDQAVRRRFRNAGPATTSRTGKVWTVGRSKQLVMMTHPPKLRSGARQKFLLILRKQP